MTKLPPLIIHDGSDECCQAAMVVYGLAAGAEVIDASTEAGRKRIDFINEGLIDGTLDTSVPPLWFKRRAA